MKPSEIPDERARRRARCRCMLILFAMGSGYEYAFFNKIRQNITLL
ncbi:MAG: hypothetical protein HQK99_01650 [Nitrospirae bacterium]|nr:hypothetical protein [Nitrospirota bacterium]